LNLQKFRAEQKQIRSTSKQLDNLTKLPVELSVSNTAADEALLSVDKDKKDKNTVWLKKISNDIYIDEGVKIVDKMIGQGALAKAK
jgi:hypothetical protein